MDITYLGHSSFRIKTKGATVVTDPFDPKMVGLKYSGVEADIVTLSHNHEDHNKSDLVKNVKKVVSGPGEYEIMGVSIIGIASFHDNESGAKRGPNTIYVYEADGLRLCHLGDLGHNLSEGQLAAIGDIDILMIPVGGDYTIGPKEAVTEVQAIDPRFIIPMHYQAKGLNQEAFSKLLPVDQFLSESGMQVDKLEKFQIKKEDILPEQGAKIVLLEV